MGQKINPTGFRIGITKTWKSRWYMPKDRYGDTVYNDFKIRSHIREKLKAAGIEIIEINRFINKVEITVKAARPGVVIGRGGEQIEKLKEDLNKIEGSKVEVKIVEVKNPDISARIIADGLSVQLERRVVPKFAMSNLLEKAVNTGMVKGIRIWVAGRIKGAEIARTEKSQWGTIPLQTLSANIDYAFTEAQVPNAGKHGIKVWVFKKDTSSEKE